MLFVSFCSLALHYTWKETLPVWACACQQEELLQEAARVRVMSESVPYFLHSAQIFIPSENYEPNREQDTHNALQILNTG